MLARYLDKLNTKTVVLVSGSAARKSLLSSMGVSFKTAVSNFPEDLTDKSDPVSYVKATCEQKLLTFVAEQPNLTVDILITADTVVYDISKSKVLEKTESIEELRDWLQSYSNSKVGCVTSFCVAVIGKNVDGVNEIKSLIQEENYSEMHFVEINEEMIEDYVKLDGWNEVAGAISIQGITQSLIKRIEGDYFSIVGLPVSQLSRVLVQTMESIDN